MSDDGGKLYTEIMSLGRSVEAGRAEQRAAEAARQAFEQLVHSDITDLRAGLDDIKLKLAETAGARVVPRLNALETRPLGDALELRLTTLEGDSAKHDADIDKLRSQVHMAIGGVALLGLVGTVLSLWGQISALVGP